MGLGKAGDRGGEVGLADARAAARAARTLLAKGINPLEERRRQHDDAAALAAGKATIPTFGKVADEFIASQAEGFRNSKHIAQWQMTLGDAYCGSIRPKPVNEVTTEDVLTILNPIWLTKHETASRVRGRIERVLNYAKIKGWRSGENPATWRGHLENVLTKGKSLKLQRGHHAAMPYKDLPDFIARLREREAMSARALEFLILTAARSGEVRGMEWSEVDLAEGIWTVPAERMKAGVEHAVPLTERAIEILKGTMIEDRPAGLVFSSGRGMMSDMTLSKLLERMGDGAYTVHGFRSSFRDWCFEVSHHPREIVETALAHQFGSATERAYRRGKALEKRRRLMEDWARFSVEKQTNVISFHHPKQPAS